MKSRVDIASADLLSRCRCGSSQGSGQERSQPASFQIRSVLQGRSACSRTLSPTRSRQGRSFAFPGCLVKENVQVSPTMEQRCVNSPLFLRLGLLFVQPAPDVSGLGAELWWVFFADVHCVRAASVEPASQWRVEQAWRAANDKVYLFFF